MSDHVLSRMFEHNNWANLLMIEACSALSDEQLDTKPLAGSEWSIRETLTHIVSAQRGYLSLLTLPVEARRADPLAFTQLSESATVSGEGLLALTRNDSDKHLQDRLRTRDGYFVDPWVVLVQAINHATDHRRQISGMLRALGLTAPSLDGWNHAESVGALVPIKTD